MDQLAKIVGSIVLTYSTHYVAANFYTNVCVPTGIWGFVQGMFTTGSPVCSATLNYVSSSQTSYTSILTVTASRLVMDMLLPSTT